MFQTITPEFYRVFQPDHFTHAGSPGWSHAPVPGWGVNPNRVGPPMLGDAGASPASPAPPAGLTQEQLQKALQMAAKQLVFTTRPPPAPFVPYPTMREVPSTMFQHAVTQSVAPWGRFPQGGAYGIPRPATPYTYLHPIQGLGAYFANRELQQIQGLGQDVQPSAPPNPTVAIGAVLGAVALGALAYIGIVGGLGYWIGGLIAPSESQKKTYRWGGAAANLVMPGVGLLALALIAAASGRVQENRSRRRHKTRSTKRRSSGRARAQRRSSGMMDRLIRAEKRRAAAKKAAAKPKRKRSQVRRRAAPAKPKRSQVVRRRSKPSKSRTMVMFKTKRGKLIQFPARRT